MIVVKFPFNKEISDPFQLIVMKLFFKLQHFGLKQINYSLNSRF